VIDHGDVVDQRTGLRYQHTVVGLSFLSVDYAAVRVDQDRFAPDVEALNGDDIAGRQYTKARMSLRQCVLDRSSQSVGKNRLLLGVDRGLSNLDKIPGGVGDRGEAVRSRLWRRDLQQASLLVEGHWQSGRPRLCCPKVKSPDKSRSMRNEGALAC